MLFTKQDLRKLIIPLIIEQILAVTIGMADTVMVSSVGEAAVSGISLVDTINILLINIFSALATGGAVVASQYLGGQDRENACVAAKQLLYSITALSLVVALVAGFGNIPILNLIFGHIDADVMGNAKIYFLLSAISYPFLAIFNAGAALFRAMGNSKVSMFTSLLMNVVNICGNALLIFVFHMGVAGAALASLASRMLGAVIMVILLQHKNNDIHINTLFHLEFKPAMVKNILRIGVPNGMENGMFQVGKILVSGLIASFGTTAIAANAVANNIASMEVIPGAAIGLGMITVVGQCVGAKDYDQAKKYTIRLTAITYLTMAVLNLAILLLSRPLVSFYQLSQETMDTAVTLLTYHSIFCMLIWPAAFTLPNGLRAANDVKFTMIISIVSMWTFRVALSWILGKVMGLGVLGVWIAMFADWIFRAAAFLIRFLRGKWRNIQFLR